MNLMGMRFRDFTWPHNPTALTLALERNVKETALPYRGSRLEDLGEAKRRITGEGYFTGEGCGEQWRQLQAVFRRGGPGSLQLPGQEPFLAVMDSLKLLGAPGEELIHYSFGFTEHRAGEDGRGRGVHTAQAGESLWDYARRYEKTMEEMIAANPHIRDIAVLGAGEEVRVP